MQTLTISNFLGMLQQDPYDLRAIEGIQEIIQARDVARMGEQPVRLMEAARQAHEARGELETVGRLIECEIALVADDRKLQGALWKELGRLRYDELLDAEAATEAYEKAKELSGEDADLEEAFKRLHQASKSWKKFAKRYEEEAESATDVSLKTSLYVRAASLIWQYKKKGREKEADDLFQKALEADPTNTRAALLFEHILRPRQKWDRLSQVLLDAAENARNREERVNLYLRAGRIFAAHIQDRNRAAACFERVLDFSPSNPEGLAFLVQYFTDQEDWDHLVALYEDALRVRQKMEVEQGILLQIGMVHWRMRGKPDEADPYFARLRKLEPAHPAMLQFYRELIGKDGDTARLLTILGDAQRVVEDPKLKLELAVEIARTAQANPSMTERSIDAWKLVQRLDPGHPEASSVLKDLYRRAQKWNALVEVLKTEFDGVPEADVERRVALLRDQVVVYRDHLNMDVMVVNTYNAILKLKPSDSEALSSLSTKYETMGRWNDLIQTLTHEAESSGDKSRKVQLYLQVAGLWIDRFANYNQATGPLEKVIDLDPENREALVKLKEIYEKKRSWKSLFEVLRKETHVASDPALRLRNTIEMARLAGDRLHHHADAIALWREVITQEPSTEGALDALEKLADREKDWGTLAEVLEKRVGVLADDESKIKVLQKLGALYEEQMSDTAAAMTAWRRILAIEPRHGRSLRTLRERLSAAGDWDGVEELYVLANDFEALADVLSGEADRVESPAIKIDLSFRAARVLEDRIGEPQRAFRSYERVLSVDPSNAKAARALIPIYEREEKWARLGGVLEVVLKSLPEQALDEKLSLLERLRRIALDQLRDGEAAFQHAAAAYRLAPGNASVVNGLEEAAQKAASYDRLIDLYLAQAERESGGAALALRRRAARIASERMNRTDVAIAQLKLIVDADANDIEAINALDVIYRAEQRHADLRGLLAHRLKHTEDSGARWGLLKELAQIEEETLGDSLAALERYRQMLAIDPTQPAVLAALDRLSLKHERWAELADILKARVDVEDDAATRQELSWRRAAVLADKLGRPSEGLDVLAGILETAPAHAPTVVSVEKLAEAHPDLQDRAAPLLERAYETAGRFDKLLKLLSARLKTTKDESEVRRLRLRVAEVSGGKLGDEVGAYGALEAAFLDRPSDTELWDRLAEAAERAGQQKALAIAYATAIEMGGLGDADTADLSVRTAKIYDELGQREDAIPFHRRVLARDPLDETSFLALKEVYTTSERWDDLQVLYRKRIEDTVDSEAKLDLLLQVCFLFEEILDRPEQAIETYRAVLELDPTHAPAIRTLDRLYERTERYRDLAALLRAQLDQSQGQDAVDLGFRLAELTEGKLGEPAKAVDLYEGVVLQQPNHLRAQQALDRLLSVETQRQRIAAILEPLYERQGAYADLARVLEISLEAADGGERFHILTRLAELHEQRLHNADAAFEAWARAVEADAADAHARAELRRLATARGAQRARANVLLRVVDAAKDAGLQADLLQELAAVLDSDLNDTEGAERAYQRLIEIDGDSSDSVLLAARALERLHMAKGDHASLAIDLRRQVEHENDAVTQRNLLIRLGTLLEETLSDQNGAIAAYAQCVESDPSDVQALRALERLYERGERWQDLIGVLQARDRVTPDEAERRGLARRVGAIYEEKLEDADNAIAAYNDALSSFGPDRETLDALARLYEAGQKWPDLLETLRSQQDLAQSAGERAEILFRSAELMRLRTDDTERALEAYEEVLQQLPGHQSTLAALDLIMADRQSPLRFQAAKVAAPRHEASGAFDKLLSVLEVMAQTDDPEEKLHALRRAAAVADDGLSDSARAFGYMGAAISAGLSDPDLRTMLKEYERLAEATGRFREMVTLLQSVVADIFDGELQPEVYRRIGDIARTRLNDAALAREMYGRVLSQLADDMPALDALEELTAEAGDHRALIDVLQRKIDLSSDPAERRRRLLRQADIYERGLDNAPAAIEALEQVVGDGPHAEAYEALERLYTVTVRWEDLAATYEQQLDRKVGDPVELHHKLGVVALSRLNDGYRAMEHFRAAMNANVAYAPTIETLEGLMRGNGEQRGAAAQILEAGYLARAEWPKLIEALEVSVEVEQDVDTRKRLLLRLAQIHEDQSEDFAGALDVYGRLFREDPHDESTWETLARLARVADRWGRLAEIYGGAFPDMVVEDDVMARLALETGRLYKDHANNPEKAAQLFAAVLAFDPTDVGAFRALEDVYVQQQQFAELQELYGQQAQNAPDDATRVELLRRRAAVFRDRLNDKPQAIATLRELLEVDPGNAAATQALDELLSQSGDLAAVADLLRHRIEHSLGSREEVDLRYRLGDLLATKLNDRSAALDVFEEIAQQHPGHQPTISALEVLVQDQDHRLRITRILDPIYRRQDQWKKLIAIMEAQLELVDDPMEKVDLLAQVAQLHEQRGKDGPLAFHAWARALGVDPHHETARASLDRLAGALGAWDEHVAAYEQALAATDDPSLSATLLTVMARVHDERRGDPRAAIQTYERLLAVDPNDPSPLDSLEALHTMVGNWRGLVDVLERKVQGAFDPQERSELLCRVGSVLEELLGDRQGAVDAYKRAVAENDADTAALESLDRLYSAGTEPEALFGVIKRRIELTDDANDRADLELRLGDLAEQQLRRAEDAIDAYQGALADRPGDPNAIASLARLYERQAMWPELLDNLKLRAGMAHNDMERVQLLHRAGEILERELDDVHEAIAVYQQVIEIDRGFDPAIRALLRIANLEDYRAQASEIVEPLLRAQGRWDEVAQLLARAIEALLDPVDRKRELLRLAEVHEEGRGNRHDAFETLCRALAEDAPDAELCDQIERLAEQLGYWERVADVFGARASSATDPTDAAALYRRLAVIAEQRLRDEPRAIEAYVRASEQDPDGRDDLQHLDRLYVKCERWQQLNDVLERRIAFEDDPSQRVALQLRVATLQEERFADHRGAFGVYREVLDNDPTEPRALAGLERLGQQPDLALDVIETLDSAYRQTNNMAKVAGLYDIKLRMAKTDGERVHLLQEVATIWENDLGDQQRALEALRQAFELDPTDAGMLEEIERVAGASNTWASLRGMMEKLSARTDVEPGVKRDLNLRAAHWYTHHLNDVIAAQACLLNAVAADPESLDAHAALVETLRAPGFERDLVAALRAWAKVEPDEYERKERLREAAALAESALNDVDTAGACLRELLAVDSGDYAALHALARIVSAQQRWPELAQLLERLIEQETDASQRLALRHQLAEALAGPLAKPREAIESYRALLDEEPFELRALNALERLYEQSERWDDLSSLLEQRLERAENAAERNAARVGLARLAEQRFGKRDEAVARLQEILDEEPGNAQALTEIERLYRVMERWDAVADLVERRVNAAAQTGDVQAQIAGCFELSALFEDKLRDPGRATAAFTRVVELDGSNRQALAALARLHEAAERWPDAIAAIETMPSLQQGSEAIQTAYRLADMSMQRLSDPDRAEAFLRHALQIEATNAETKKRLMQHYETQGNHAKIGELLALEVTQTDDAATKVQLLRKVSGIFQLKLNDPARAVGYLEQAVALVPDNREILLPLCDLYIAAGRQADAVPVLEKIIASFGGKRVKEVAGYEHRLGQALEGMGKLDEALVRYDAAFKIDLTNVQILRDLGRLCLAKGDLDRANKTFRALLLQKLAPDSGISKADVYFYLGDISARTGDKAKAKQMLERAIAEGGSHPQAKAMLDAL